MMEIEMNWNQTETELKNQNLEYEKKVKALEYQLNETIAVLNLNEIIQKNSKVNIFCLKINRHCKPPFIASYSIFSLKMNKLFQKKRKHLVIYLLNINN